MQFTNFSDQEFSPEEIKQLEEFRTTIEAAISNGKLSHYKIEHLKSIAFANKKLLSAELHLYRTMVLDKVECGELEYEWS
jgi:hypothetical protein